MSSATTSVTVGCPSCGKQLRVPESRLGKAAKCPGCMTTFTVAAPGGAPVAAPGGFAPSRLGKKREEAGRVAVSPKVIALLIVAAVVGGGVMMVVWGPLRVRSQWDAMKAQAQQDSEDVVVRGLEAHLSSERSYDPSKRVGQPGTRELKFIFEPALSMKMPEKVPFVGQSTQGRFGGHYYPATKEIEADVEVGGFGIAGLAGPVMKGDKKIKVTGRRKDGQVTVEVDGKPGEIVFWNKRREE